jgi:hypothetical protein
MPHITNYAASVLSWIRNYIFNGKMNASDLIRQIQSQATLAGFNRHLLQERMPIAAYDLSNCAGFFDTSSCSFEPQSTRQSAKPHHLSVVPLSINLRLLQIAGGVNLY